MKGKIRKNQDGSVLLAVVCMSMMCITMATIALSVVNYTTKATSRNVQRTQAKVTAESVLTEFVNSYTADELQAMVGETVTLQVKDADNGDADVTSDFESSYGDVTLEISSVSGSSTSFKVQSSCTYSTQTQTASVVFETVSSNPTVPSNTLEASDGINMTDGVASPMDGSVYIDKKTSGTTLNYVTLGCNDATFNSQIYSEYSLYFNSNCKYLDSTNKTGTLNYEPNKTSGDGNYFKQAPTITTEGYIYFYNNVKVSTDVGKTDVNMKNNDDSGYDSTNLSNRDGYICADKKIWFGMPNAVDVGSNGNPIDMYCHGMYIGCMPTTLDGATNADYVEIQAAYTDTSGNYNLGTGQIGTYKSTGNIYCYTGTGTHETGDMFICNGSNSVTIDGDLVVEGKLYLLSGTNLTVTGTLYASEIVVLDSSYNTIFMGNIQSDGTVKEQTGYSLTNYSVSISGNKTNVMPSKSDTAADRDAYPTDGYDPSTGIDNTTRKNLSTKYSDASANGIFSESMCTNSPSHSNHTDLLDASKDIAYKYACAMTRTLSTKKYLKSDGVTEANLTDKFTKSSTKITQINGSVRLSSSDLGDTSANDYKKYYSVKLTDEDIIIALPLSASGINQNAFFRIDTTDIATDASGNPAEVFVYFMYYVENSDSDALVDSDPGNNVINNCLYYNGTINGSTIATPSVTVPVYDGSSFSTQDVKFAASDSTYRSAYTVKYDQGGKDLCMVSDLMLYSTYDSDTTITFDMFINYCANKLTEGVADAVTSGEGYSNRIFYLVPDDCPFYLGDNTQIQGIVYAPQSNVQFAGSGAKLFGQVKCKTYSVPNDTKTAIVSDIPAAAGSILDFVNAKNKAPSTGSPVQLRYYEY